MNDRWQMRRRLPRRIVGIILLRSMRGLNPTGRADAQVEGAGALLKACVEAMEPSKHRRHVCRAYKRITRASRVDGRESMARHHHRERDLDRRTMGGGNGGRGKAKKSTYVQVHGPNLTTPGLLLVVRPRWKCLEALCLVCMVCIFMITLSGEVQA